MIRITLDDLEFYSHIGIHGEEQKIAGLFIVNVELLYQERVGIINELSETINYVKVYEIVKQRMKQNSALLENVAMEIGSQLLSEFLNIKFIRIDITKQHPPIAGFVGKVGVSWFKNID